MHSEDKPAAVDPAAPATARRGEALEPPAPPPSAPAEPRRRGGGTAIAWLALLLAAGGGAAGYFAVRQLDALQRTQAQRLEELATALQSARQTSDELAARLTQLEREVPAVTAELAGVEEILRRDARQRVEPADVERLLRMANDSLQLQRDRATALHALRAADQRLQALADPIFAEVRRRLAQEITALAAVPQPDIAGMVFTLGSLQAELESLPVKRSAPAPAAEPPAADTGTETVSGWRSLWRALWAEFKGLVVVRRREGGQPPLLSPAEEVYLTQNLHLKLETARLALLARDNTNFHASLAAAQSWLRDYYDAGSAPVAAVGARIGELQQVDIAPTLPDISTSLQALRAALERRRDGGAAGRPAAGREDGGA